MNENQDPFEELEVECELLKQARVPNAAEGHIQHSKIIDARIFQRNNTHCYLTPLDVSIPLVTGIFCHNRIV